MEERRACAARRTNGEPCRKPPIKGGAVCATHGGSAPQVKAAAAQRLARAAGEAAVTRFGLDVTVDPGDALLGEVSRSAALVRWLGDQLAGMADADVAGSPEWQAWTTERQHLGRVSKAALDAGVDARRVALAEAQAETVADVIRAVLDGLGLTPEQRVQALSIIRARLSSLG